MSEVKDIPVATVIGDIVDSRKVSDRTRLHILLRKIVHEANGTLSPVTPLRITVGDEFQGAFAGVGEAIHAALWLRLELLPIADLRHGIGWGTASVLERDPRVEDGPGWWAARSAIEAVKSESSTSLMGWLRTCYQSDPGAHGPDAAPVNAALICRDQLLGQCDDRAIQILHGLLAGRLNREIADELGITPSAVSQRIRSNGLAAITAASDLLKGLT